MTEEDKIRLYIEASVLPESDLRSLALIVSLHASQVLYSSELEKVWVNRIKNIVISTSLGMNISVKKCFILSIKMIISISISITIRTRAGVRLGKCMRITLRV